MPLVVQLQLTSESYLWLIACLILGLVYAFFLYQQSKQLDKNLRYFLFALRASAIATIAFLLCAPLVKTLNRTVEKPLIIFAQDNSASILAAKNKDFDRQSYNKQVQKLAKVLSADFELRTFNFDRKVRDGLDLNYSGSSTDISSLFKLIDDKFSNRNIGALILSTDGIYNRGANPLYESKKIKSPIYTIALGDTIAKRDLLISSVNYNSVAYLNNEFQIGINLEAYQCKGLNDQLTVSSASGMVTSKPIGIKNDEFRQSVLLNVPAQKKGIQTYTIRISPISNEHTLVNNSQTIFIEVIDGKKNILTIANAPHPDLSAIRQSIEIHKNYAVKLRMVQDVSQVEMQEADLLILHQLPSSNNAAKEILKLTALKPTLYILGAQSNFSAFSAAQQLLSLSPLGETMEEVKASMKADFYSFTLSESSRLKISNFGPLSAPFANFGVKGSPSILINQQLGSINTGKPILLFSGDSQPRLAILTAEGIWRWRLEDYQENSSHEAFDELITKTVQYLVSADDKRKLRVYTTKNTFDEDEPVLLNAELYNDAMELNNKPDVRISILKKGGKSYSYIFSRTLNSYNLDAGELPAGEYNYTAVAALGKSNYQAIGQFIISKQQTEFKQTRANHQLLYAMATQNGGQMLFPKQMDELPTLIKANEQVKTIAYENPKYTELIDLKLLFFAILAFLSLEWFFRKRNSEI